MFCLDLCTFSMLMSVLIQRIKESNMYIADASSIVTSYFLMFRLRTTLKHEGKMLCCQKTNSDALRMIRRLLLFAFSFIKQAKLTMRLHVESYWTAVRILTMPLDSCLQQKNMFMPQTSVLTSPLAGKGNVLFRAGAWQARMEVCSVFLWVSKFLSHLLVCSA